MALLIALTLVAGLATGGGVRLWREDAGDQALHAPARDDAFDPETREGVLTWMTATGLPAYAGWIGVDRWTYPPHSAPVTSAPLSGPALIFVTAGQVTVSLSGERAQYRGLNHDQPKALFSATTGRLAADESLLVPANTRMTTWNEEPTLAKALVVIIMNNSANDWQLPFDQTTIAQETLATTRGEITAQQVQIELSRRTLAPGERLAAPDAGALRLVAAESKYLAYLGRPRDGAVTNLEAEPVGVLIVTITDASSAPSSTRAG